MPILEERLSRYYSSECFFDLTSHTKEVEIYKKKPLWISEDTVTLIFNVLVFQNSLISPQSFAVFWRSLLYAKLSAGTEQWNGGSLTSRQNFSSKFLFPAPDQQEVSEVIQWRQCAVLCYDSNCFLLVMETPTVLQLLTAVFHLPLPMSSANLYPLHKRVERSTGWFRSPRASVGTSVWRRRQLNSLCVRAHAPRGARDVCVTTPNICSFGRSQAFESFTNSLALWCKEFFEKSIVYSDC